MLLQDLHRSVTEIKDRLRLDEERIRLEREKLIEAEQSVRHQEERLRLTFDQLEINESRYQMKGKLRSILIPPTWAYIVRLCSHYRFG